MAGFCGRNAFRGTMSVLALVAALSAAAAPKEILYVGGEYDPPDEPVLKPFYDRLVGKGVCSRHRVVNGLDNLTAADLASARTVVVRRGRNYELSRHDRAALDALVEYVRAGGGVVILGSFWQMFAHSEFGVQLMKAFGGTVLYEGVRTPTERCVRIGEWQPDVWAVTTRVAPLFGEGVKRVLYRTPYRQNWEHGVVPFLPTKEWKVALASEDGVISEPFKPMGLEMLDGRVRAKGFDRCVPIVGYRTFGQGRVVWFGITDLLNRSVSPADAANTDVAERILWKGAKGMGPVETGRFLENLFGWVGANAGGVDAAKLPRLVTAKEDDRSLGTDYRLYRGVIGPRTTLSSGRSTPEAFIAKAKKLGLDFVVFLEDFSALSAANFEKLRETCRAATDDRFSAWPGYAFSRDNGNRQFVFSTDPLYPGKRWLTADGRQFISVTRTTPENGYVPNGDSNFSGTLDLEYFYGILSFNNNRGWHLFHKSPYRAADTSNVQSIGVITRVNGRTVETAFDAYVDNVQQGYQLWPMTLELMDSAETLGPDTYLTYCGANGLAEFRRLMLEWGVNSGIAGHANFGLQSTSNGPEIEFRAARAHYSGDETILYSKEFPRWPYELAVRSSKGLDAVEIYDGGRLFRRWKADGAKEFVRRGSFACERQHYLWVKVVDRAGRTGFTRPADSHTFVLRENACSDRNNLLFYSDQKRRDGTHMIGNHSGETALPNHIVWPPRIKPVGYFALDRKYGVGEFGVFDGSPEDHPQVWMSPSVEYGGTPSEDLGWVREFVAGREGGPHVFPRRIVASSDALVGDRVLDGVYKLGRKPLTHGCQGLHPVYDSAYADTTARCSLFIPKLDGIIAYQWEQTLSLKQQVPSAAGKAIVDWGFVRPSSKAEYVDASVGGRRLSGCAAQSFDMAPGDFLVVKNPVYGSLAVYPLAPVRFEAMGWKAPGDGSTYPKGTSFAARFAFVGMNRFTADPFAFAAEIAAGYGIGASRPGYRAELSAGRGRPNGVCFDATAEKGALAGRFAGLAKLPGTLGLRLSGLNDRQVAVLAKPDDVRLVPVEGGTAYVALRDEESDCSLFVGHPFVCTSKDLVLGLSKQIGRPWILEVHNPTDRPVRAKVSADPRCPAFAFARDLKVEAGASLDFELQGRD